MPELVFLLVPVFIVVFGVLAYYSHLQAKKRREALLGWSLQRQWRFAPSSDYHWDRRYPQFSCFNQGHSRQAYNRLYGTINVGGQAQSCVAGDYLYKRTSGSGKNRRTKTYRFSFLLVELPFVGVPQLAVRPEGFFDGMAAVFGFDDIDFESEEFSRKFHVQSVDKRFTYDLIHPRMMQYMLGTPPATFEIQHGVFCLLKQHACWEVDELDRQVNWCEQWFDLWPPHLIADLNTQHAR